MFIYNLLMHSITLLSPLAQFMGDKPKMWYEGRRGLLKRVKQEFKDNNQPVVWFHCASLGEFEQGRQLIEDIRREYPQYKILVTFFSPSGYEVRKNYQMADCIMYLPVDSPTAARAFVNAINPKIVIFVKYEFWTNILAACRKVGAKVYVVSAIFRPNQQFFKWWGLNGRYTLSLFDHIFVQNSYSKELLASIGICNVTVAGDTRFDRVYSLSMSAKRVEQVEWFAEGNRKIFVAGSTWQPDDSIIINLIENHSEMKFIIVPHELGQSKIESLKSKISFFGRKVVCYTENRSKTDIAESDVMIIDVVGVLSSTYRYATLAYIGGGFGVGIHNTLEAATYGLPVAFGPNYTRFAEAVDLITIGAATSVNCAEQLIDWTDRMLADNELLRSSGEKSSEYVASKIGASKIIRQYISDDIKK